MQGTCCFDRNDVGMDRERSSDRFVWHRLDVSLVLDDVGWSFSLAVVHGEMPFIRVGSQGATTRICLK